MTVHRSVPTCRAQQSVTCAHDRVARRSAAVIAPRRQGAEAPWARGSRVARNPGTDRAPAVWSEQPGRSLRVHDMARRCPRDGNGAFVQVVRTVAERIGWGCPRRPAPRAVGAAGPYAPWPWPWPSPSPSPVGFAGLGPARRPFPGAFRARAPRSDPDPAFANTNSYEQPPRYRNEMVDG